VPRRVSTANPPGRALPVLTRRARPDPSGCVGQEGPVRVQRAEQSRHAGRRHVRRVVDHVVSLGDRAADDLGGQETRRAPAAVAGDRHQGEDAPVRIDPGADHVVDEAPVRVGHGVTGGPDEEQAAVRHGRVEAAVSGRVRRAGDEHGPPSGRDVQDDVGGERLEVTGDGLRSGLAFDCERAQDAGRDTGSGIVSTASAAAGREEAQEQGPHGQVAPRSSCHHGLPRPGPPPGPTSIAKMRGRPARESGAPPGGGG
jgi:hypothetical protein